MKPLFAPAHLIVKLRARGLWVPEVFDSGAFGRGPLTGTFYKPRQRGNFYFALTDFGESIDVAAFQGYYLRTSFLKREKVSGDMRIRYTGILAVFLPSAVLLLPRIVLCENRPLPPCEATTGEMGFLSTYVVSAVPPGYPAASIRAGHQGIAVAGVCLGDRPPGTTVLTASSVEILTAPDADIAQAMREALAKWRFRPPVGGQEGREIPLKLYSKITYYFVKKEQHWAVLSPTESFYLGPRFALTGQKVGESTNLSNSKGR